MQTTRDLQKNPLRISICGSLDYPVMYSTSSLIEIFEASLLQADEIMQKEFKIGRNSDSGQIHFQTWT